MGSDISRKVFPTSPSAQSGKNRARRTSVPVLASRHLDAPRKNGKRQHRRSSTTWKAPPNITKIRRESNVFQQDPILLELRLCLDEPLGQKHLGAFAKQTGCQEALFCWVDIQEYKSIPKSDYRRHFAQYIYDKYIKDSAKMKVAVITAPLRTVIEEKLAVAAKSPKSLEEALFEDVQLKCMTEIQQTAYLKFRQSDAFQVYQKEVKDTYNKVVVEDFEYMDLLGVGGYARVFHVRKISTGRHYAMKVQLKKKLVEENLNYPENMVSERKLLALCHHPYLIDLHYAFQTDKYIIMVLELMRAGDLSIEVANELERTLYGLSEERVQLYVAEISLVLGHLHNMGVIYRDLKPCNVLLGEDGHIKLADMGFAKRTNAPLDEMSDNWDFLNSRNILPVMAPRSPIVTPRPALAASSSASFSVQPSTTTSTAAPSTTSAATAAATGSAPAAPSIIGEPGPATAGSSGTIAGPSTPAGPPVTTATATTNAGSTPPLENTAPPAPPAASSGPPANGSAPTAPSIEGPSQPVPQSQTANANGALLGGAATAAAATTTPMASVATAPASSGATPSGAPAAPLTARTPLVRAKSTVGTRGYLAPEIIKGRLHSRAKRKPYTEAVDYWALGVSCYEMLTGTMPFQNLDISELFDSHDGTQKQRLTLKESVQYALKQLGQDIQFPANISEPARKFIRGLLEVEPEKRMAFDTLKKHEFLSTIDWDKLAMKHLVPNSKPRVRNLPEKPKFSTFEVAMGNFDSFDKKMDWYAEFSPEYQHYFADWDFISPQTLKIELGIAVQMDASNIPFKICQITGEAPLPDD